MYWCNVIVLEALDALHVACKSNVAAALEGKPVPTTGAVAGIMLFHTVAEVIAPTNCPVCMKLANVPSPAARSVSSQSRYQVVVAASPLKVVQVGLTATFTAPITTVKIMVGVDVLLMRPEARMRRVCPGAVK